MAINMGWATKVAVGSSDPTDTRLNFSSFSMAKQRTIIQPQGGDGNIDPINSRVRYGNTTITGTLVCEPTAVELATYLPWIFGASASMTSYPLGTTFTEKYLNYDAVQDCYLYTGTKVTRAVLECLPNQPATLALDLSARIETTGDTFPSLTADTTTNYFVLSDMVVTVNSVTTCTELLRVTWDMTPMLYFTNCSVAPTDSVVTERTITVELLPAYNSDHTSLFPQSESGWAVVATLTNGAVSLAFTWPKVIFNHQTPGAASMRDIVKLPLVGRAFRTSGAAAQSCTLDSTP